MKKTNAIIIAVMLLLAAFFIFCLHLADKDDENNRRGEFNGVYIPKEWKILKDKAIDIDKTYRIYSRDFFHAVIIVKKNIEFDEQTLRKLVQSVRYMRAINIDEFKIYYSKKLNNKIQTVRFIKEKDEFNNLLDVIIKKIGRTEIAVVYSKGGEYVKSNSGENEPVDINAMEFISKIEKDLL